MLFDSCKKGEDDPFFSLRSRKARVVGEWKMTSIKSTGTYLFGGILATNEFTANGSNYTETSTTLGTTTIDEGTLSYDIEFKKDGTFEIKVNQDDDPETYNGVWNFTGGVGELKNKSQITMFEKSSSDSNGSNGTTGHYFDETFDLKELRQKKMVLYYKTESSEDGVTYSTKEFEMVLEAK